MCDATNWLLSRWEPDKSLPRKFTKITSAITDSRRFPKDVQRLSR